MTTHDWTTSPAILTDGAWVRRGHVLRWVADVEPAEEPPPELPKGSPRIGYATSLILQVAAECKVTPSAIVSRRRDRRVVEARHLVAWVLRQHGFSYVGIGLILNQHHTSIIYAVRKMSASTLQEAS